MGCHIFWCLHCSRSLLSHEFGKVILCLSQCDKVLFFSNSFGLQIKYSLYIKSFILESRFINIQQDTLTLTNLIPVEQISKKFQSCFNVLEYGIHYQAASKTP